MRRGMTPKAEHAFALKCIDDMRDRYRVRLPETLDRRMAAEGWNMVCKRVPRKESWF